MYLAASYIIILRFSLKMVQYYSILPRIYTGVPELPHDILIGYSKINTKSDRKNVNS
jgi:hypothetical protein